MSKPVKKMIFLSSFLLFNNGVYAVSNFPAIKFYLGPGVSFQTRQSDDVRNISWHPRIQAGIGAPLKYWFYLGAEAYYDPVTINQSNNEVAGVNLKTTHNYGASIIPGVILDSMFMAYLRLGAVTTHFNYPDISKTGQEGGAGLEVRIVDCLSLRAEYDYVYYHNVTSIGIVRSNNYATALLWRF